MSHDYTLHEEEQSSFDFGMILSAAKRRYLFFLIPFLVILVAATVVTMSLKPIYESTGTILVETQQIPTDLVQSSVTSDPNQRITIIQQRVMTRRNLLEIIDKYNVFGDDRKNLPVSTLIQRMQNLIDVSVITSQVSGGHRRSVTTIAFTVSFEYEVPEIAAKVTNELVTLFLSENVKTRTARASETTAFLENEAQKLRSQLEEVEGQIVAYKQEHRDKLPEHLSLRLTMLERAEAEIRDMTREIRSLEEEKRYLQIELTSARSGRTTAGGVVGQTELQSNIEDLKDALLDASTRLTASHPDIIALNKRIAALEAQQAEVEAAAQASASTDSDPTPTSGYNPLVETLQARIQSADQKIAEARQQIVVSREKVEELEGIIIDIPQVERGLATLDRTYQDLLQSVNELERKQAQAQLSQNLEEEKKAERFILLEPPAVPSVPVRPDRKKILGIGALAAFAAGIGFVVLIELLDRRVRSASELEALLKHPPIVSIPYITTQSESGKRKYRLLIILLIPVVAALVGLAAIHFLYEPLDSLFYKAWVAIDRLRVTLF